MVNHPRRNRLAKYGGRIIDTDGKKTVELTDEGRRFQYRRFGAGIERRVLMADGTPFRDGSPWEQMTDSDMRQMVLVRGNYHPVLDTLGL